jgi:NAD(P)H-nitrite reductase large subunit
MKKIVIIGNGIAATTAARHIRSNSQNEITMISGETEYPFSRTALMYVYMGHMKFEHTKLFEDHYWEQSNIHLIKDWVSHVDLDKKSIDLQSGGSITYDTLIIASGSKPNRLGCPGQDLIGVQGLYHKHDLEMMEAATKSGINRAVIVGGGLIGIEMAEMFHARNIDVTMLVRENSFWNIVLPPEESEMVNQHILAKNIDLRLNEELVEIKGIHGKASSVVCKNSDKEIVCDFVGLTIGVSPNIDFIRPSGIACNRGILVDKYLQSSCADVFAIGDCAELSEPCPGRRPIEAIWYTARTMGETVAKTISGQPTKYDPGIWFNSAKFFDIEYQVYGDIPPQKPVDVTSLFWKHPSQNKAIRINYHTVSGIITGFSLMGIRYRHMVCQKWIEEKTAVESVLENLSSANFDPEFFESFEHEIIAIYNQKSGKSVPLKSIRKSLI